MSSGMVDDELTIEVGSGTDTLTASRPADDTLTVGASPVDTLIVEGVLPPPPVFELFDDFNRADGDPWDPWIRAGGIWEIRSEAVELISVGYTGVDYSWMGVHTGTNDHEVTADLTQGTQGQIAIRIADSRTSILLWQVGVTIIVITRSDDGSANTNQIVLTLPAIPTQPLTLGAKGDVGYAIVEGVRHEFTVPPTTKPDRGYAGMIWSGTPTPPPPGVMRIDDIHIRSLDW